VGPSADDLHAAMFGTQTRRDRAHLTVVPRATTEDEMCTGAGRLLVPLVFILGVVMLPVGWLLAGVAFWLVGGGQR